MSFWKRGNLLACHFNQGFTTEFALVTSDIYYVNNVTGKGGKNMSSQEIRTNLDPSVDFIYAGGGIVSLPRECRKSCRSAVQFEKQAVTDMVECMGRAGAKKAWANRKLAEAQCAGKFMGKVGISRARDWNGFRNNIQGAREFGAEVNR